ncbi:histone lysine demethylase JMJD6a [Toxoplasma gondii p89]|uniref:Histone lysine demethylase JMJD6a n=2 Tax=Toxoplasma gondii TaxID=5811 RepID=A0A086K5J4_TOXGO|nr:histone lysine demethylase JMJD6a [Toxoplasma gondii p89]
MSGQALAAATAAVPSGAATSPGSREKPTANEKSPQSASAAQPDRSLLRSRSGYTYYGPSGEFFRHKKTADRVRRAKKYHRKDIGPSEWGKYNYVSSTICEDSFHIKETLPRIYKSETTLKDFVEKFEIPCKPVLLCGWMDDWPAMHRWEPRELERRFRSARFKVGEKDDGEKIRMKMKYFIDYMENQRDDSPLYLFESAVEERADTCGLLDDWTVPEVFPMDLHAIVGEERRPPHRWFCIGPKRSGTTVHVDPLGTAAWNAVTHGVKRWALFPPAVPRHVVKAKHLLKRGEDDEAIMWFDFLLPRIREKYPDVPIYECLQKPGEVIYVPGGWWHAVLNLTDCVACTQNFVSFSFLTPAWRSTRRGRRRYAVLWKERFRRFFPESVGLGVLDDCDALDGWEVRDGKFCRMQTQRGAYVSESSSSSSSSSSSDSESSDDEDELEEISKKVAKMREGVDADTWNLYAKTNAVLLQRRRQLLSVCSPATSGARVTSVSFEDRSGDVFLSTAQSARSSDADGKKEDGAGGSADAERSGVSVHLARPPETNGTNSPGAAGSTDSETSEDDDESDEQADGREKSDAACGAQKTLKRRSGENEAGRNLASAGTEKGVEGNGRNTGETSALGSAAQEQNAKKSRLLTSE